jgi:hypothetical protein
MVRGALRRASLRQPADFTVCVAGTAPAR